MNRRSLRRLVSIACLASLAIPAAGQDGAPGVEEVRAIAREAYIYGFPMVDHYRIQHAYFVDKANPEFKAPWNEIRNMPRVFTSQDKAIQTPNSDTPYSMLGLDLRAEPVVITVPVIDTARYFSIQLIDAYTFNFDYIGSRTTGNDGGSYLIAGPDWKGEKPPGVDKVLRSETEFVFALFRTQLFNPDDLDKVKEVQAGYRAETLSAFLKQAAPAPAPKIDFITPLTPDQQKTSLEVFNILNFALQYCPIHPSEKDLMARFARIGVGAGRKIDVAGLTPELKQAYAEGIADAWKEFGGMLKDVETGKVASGEIFGTREFLRNNYLHRMGAAVLGIYGNSKEEAMYPAYRADADGNPMDASKHRYVLRFAPGQLPPVDAFWSVTMYELPSSLLAANSINRYLINSPMLPGLKKDPDGGLTLHLQHESPGADKEANWLPAPKGPFWCAMRLYRPQQSALDGNWKQPAMQPVE